jgi:predicted nucleic acid-binding protein
MTVYLDTSSLVKLFLEESGSDQVRALAVDATVIVTSVVAYAETRAALARRRRERLLTPRAFSTAKRAFEGQWPRFASIEVTADVARQAGDLAERFALRGFDSVHLASFVSIASQAPAGGVAFSSFDDALNRAAAAWLRQAKRASVSRRPPRS